MGQKEKIHNDKARPFFHEREVIWALPLTRTDKTGKYYFRISLVADGSNTDDRPSVVILSQIRLVDAKRLQYKVGMIKEAEFIKIKEAMTTLLK